MLPDDLRSSELACAALEWMGPNVLEGYTVSVRISVPACLALNMLTLSFFRNSYKP